MRIFINCVDDLTCRFIKNEENINLKCYGIIKKVCARTAECINYSNLDTIRQLLNHYTFENINTKKSQHEKEWSDHIFTRMIFNTKISSILY